jgi:MFS family permease
MATLATFAVGFVVRPFGLFFGLGDLIGRKYTFMVTLLLMGGATFLIGCVPSYETIGFMAPVLVILRMLQGLALGGEYGGAATYGTPRRTKRILDFLDSNNSRFIHF